MPPLPRRDGLAAGDLVRVLGARQVASAGIYLVYPSSKTLPRKVTAFRDFLLEWLRAHALP